MERSNRNRLGAWGSSPTPRIVFPPVTSQLNNHNIHNLREDNISPYECIDEERQIRHGSGVGFGGPYHLGSSRDGLDGGLTYRARSGSDGDGEDDSPPPHRHGHTLATQKGNQMMTSVNPSNAIGVGHPHSHMNSQSLRRGRARPPPHYQTPNIPGTTQALLQENPYQQPYLGRSAGLSDSPTSENASDATLTDSELPFTTNQATLPLQNGGLMLGGTLEFSNSGRMSLKRNMNTNGKSQTGLGMVNHNHNHDVNRMDQFVMQTPGGKIYIPQDTPKNSTSDFKTSPSSSPSKKTSGSLLYKDTVHMGSLHGVRQRTKSDDDDYLYKFKGFCNWKSAVIILLCLLLLSILLNFLFGFGALPWTKENAKECTETSSRIDERRETSFRQSTNNGSSGVEVNNKPPSISGGPDIDAGEGMHALAKGMRTQKGLYEKLHDGTRLKRALVEVDGDFDQNFIPFNHLHAEIKKRPDTDLRSGLAQKGPELSVAPSGVLDRDDMTNEAPTQNGPNHPHNKMEFEVVKTPGNSNSEKLLDQLKWVGWKYPHTDANSVELAPSHLQDNGARFSTLLLSYPTSSTRLTEEGKEEKLIEGDRFQNNDGQEPQTLPLPNRREDEEIPFISPDPHNTPKTYDQESEDGNEISPFGSSLIFYPIWTGKPNDSHLQLPSSLPSPISSLFSRKEDNNAIGGSGEKILLPDTELEIRDPDLSEMINETPATQPPSEKTEELRREFSDTPRSHQDLSEDGSNISLPTTAILRENIEISPPKGKAGGVCECYCPCLETFEEEGSGSGSYALLPPTHPPVQDPLDMDLGEEFLPLENGDLKEVIEGSGGDKGSGHNLITSWSQDNKLSPEASFSFIGPQAGHLNKEGDEAWVNDNDSSGSGAGGIERTWIQTTTKDDEEASEDNFIPVFPNEKSKREKPLIHAAIESPNPLTNGLESPMEDTCRCPQTPTESEGSRTFPAVNFPPDGTSFTQISLGTRLSNVIGSYSYWNMQFYQSEGAYVTWEFSVPRGASIGFYARRNALPTHTHYDFMEILRGFKSRPTRSSPPSVSKEVNNFLEQGHWFLSLYNDDSDSQEVVFSSTVSEEMTEGCPNGCSGNGQCTLGHCQCNAGFGGEDCSQSVCPVLCSGRGEYVNGECQCNPGWKGKECSLRHDECEVSDCNGHGKCASGKCACVRGYKGDYCQEVDCPHPNCSGHGFCFAGNCMCKKGWRGVECSQPDNEALQCLPDCSSHGTFNLESQNCNCEPRWTGEDCSQELCDSNCGVNGVCINGGCQCSEGWSGKLCNQRVCDKRCADHGQCKNGTCLCVTGWNGRHCTLEGCPASCNGHGQCKANYEGFWECKCHNGWTGPECSVMMEQICNDGKDNDKDGLADCEDPECCSQPQCEKSQLCVSAKKPIDILLRKQPPAITASFFEKMKFLIEEGSLQSYARQDAFNGSRSGVVRGRVVTPNGSGLMGVRVSSSSPLEPLGGFTLTQDDGWFDLMVNGGGAVTLQFGRSPFNSQTRTIFVPWNEVVIIDTVMMGSMDDKIYSNGPVCESHDYETMKPVVLATWKHGFQGDCSETSAILKESQVVQESIRIPGTGLHLMYHSSRVSGYLSTIQLQLTSSVIPSSLKRIHLRIAIEGVLFEKTFEADPDIRFTYPWNRLNVYRQRVYGLTTAIVKIGYEYDNCAQVIWDVQSTTLSGHDMGISEIGGWNIDIHHRYNFHEGIIQKGDGANIYLKHRPRVIITTMGNGYQRALDCTSECNGVGSKQKLLAPVALASAPDSSLFVGDFNLIRRIMVDGTVHNVVKLNATRVSYRYHMALSPVDNILYISDPESHQIIKVRNIEDMTNIEQNWESVVGSGERCLPGDEAHCGDEALARDAKLAYPKGVAMSSDNVLYFADGTNIRKVDRDGIITTVIGNHQQKSHWKPIPCEGTLKVEEVHLRWPTELAVNPLDNSLYIIDDHMILKLTDDNRIRIVAGRPFHCPIPPGGYDADLATHSSLISPQSITFGSNGDLYVAESDSQRTNRIRLISTNGKISHFAGAESKCNCLDRGCACFEDDHYLAATAKMNTISSIAMSPEGVLHVSDQGNYRIRSIMALIPQQQGPSQPSDQSRQYEIFSPETQEIYVFNRFGQHVATKNIVTGETIYTFLYNVNMSNGKLSSVTDAAGNKIQILRDYSQQVKTIENAQAQKFNLKMSRVRMLQEFSTPEGYNITFDYWSSTGLIKSRQDSSGRSSIYTYDEFGRLVMAVSPSGQVVTLHFELSQKGANVKVTRDTNYPESILIKGSTVHKRINKMEEITSVQPDGNVIRIYPSFKTVTTETVPYNILSDISPVLADSFPVPGKQKTELSGDLLNRVEWRYVARKEGKGKNKQIVQVDKKMRINGENVLMVEYDRETNSELIFIDDRNLVLNVSYDRSGRSLKWEPSHGFSTVDLEYDRFGRLIGWKWDELSESYEYDRSGRLFKIKYADGISWTHVFKDILTTMPNKMTTGGGSDYLLDYDGVGAFQSLTTPRGHIHTFGFSTSIGVYEYQYKAPSSRDVYKIQYNDLGQIVSIVYPQGSGRINYVYNKGEKLEASVAGLRSAQFFYQENSGLLKVVEVAQSSFELKVEYKYQGGFVKELREKFGSKTGLDNIHMKYQYDGNGRATNVEIEVNGKVSQGLTMTKNQNTGKLETFLDLTFEGSQNGKFNRSTIQDLSKVFFLVKVKDGVGRVKVASMNIKGNEVFKLEVTFDAKGKVRHRKMNIGHSAYADNIVYDDDGHVSEVIGSGNWKYVYDENGNAIQIVEQGEKSSLIYDSGDRVIQVGELLRYTYDQRGFLVQRGNEKFQYDDKGLLIHVVKKDAYKVWFFYDHLDRLTSWKDDQGNVSQFIYGNPDAPDLMTHIHFPLTGKSTLFIYDGEESGASLVAFITSDSQRFYVATDQHGSPIGIFNVHGSIVKEIHRTPFGKIVRDTNQEFYLPIDFRGGVVDKHTGLVIIRGRPYEPTIGQWMVPSWNKLPSDFKRPTDIFTYRFARNDPITPRHGLAERRMISLDSWLALYGFDMDKIFGQNYVKGISVEPYIGKGHLSPEFGVVSGLDCMAATISSSFKNFGFNRDSKLSPESLLNKELDLMSKIAYKRTAFGPGLLVSRMENGRALVSTVDNSVIQGVITSVLNGTLFVDFKSAHSSNFYFVKDNPHKLRDDMEELKRLGGLYNISVHDAENGIKELKLSSGETVVSVRYGADPDEEYQRLVKHAHRRAIERAWEEEKHYISMGLDGRRAWTDEEKDQLLSKGLVHGYRPSDLFSIHKFPHLADDPNNVVFERDSRRKRRKSNKRHRDRLSPSS